MQLTDITTQTKAMIDDLKAICTNYGLGNASSEYKIITEAFLYKFLNDKLYMRQSKLSCFQRYECCDVEAAMSKCPMRIMSLCSWT